MCRGKSVSKSYVQHISHQWCLLEDTCTRQWENFKWEVYCWTKKQLQKHHALAGEEILQHWCSNGSKCQKIFALTGFSIPSVKNFTMADNETYKTMAKLRVIQQLSSGLGHRNLLLQLVSRINSWWISWLEYVDFVDEHSLHSGDTTKSKWQMMV